MTDRTRQVLIQSLTKNLQPVRRRSNVVMPALFWLAFSWSYVILLAITVGPIRAGAVEALTTLPHFVLESSIGLLITGLFCLLAFRESVPGTKNNWLLWAAVSMSVLWIGNHVIGLVAPALEPSMEGKRAHCVIEAFFYSGPPLWVGYYVLHRCYPLRPVRAGLYLGLSAGAIPALLMQFACMYLPAHILTHHIAPIIVVAGAGGAIGYFFNKEKPVAY